MPYGDYVPAYKRKPKTEDDPAKVEKQAAGIEEVSEKVEKAAPPPKVKPIAQTEHENSLTGLSEISKARKVEEAKRRYRDKGEPIPGWLGGGISTKTDTPLDMSGSETYIDPVTGKPTTRPVTPKPKPKR